MDRARPVRAIVTFELATFGAFRAEEIRRMGARLLWDLEVGEPERKPLDRATVEVLVGPLGEDASPAGRP